MTDINMPVMDGYEVLEAVCKQDLNAMVIVVSGDIQPEAREKVMAFGALDFIKKPVSKEKIADILKKYGVINESDLLPDPVVIIPPHWEEVGVYVVD